MGLLKAARAQVDPMGDLGTEDERVLGKLVKDKYHTDFYILYRYPLAVRHWGRLNSSAADCCCMMHLQPQPLLRARVHVCPGLLWSAHRVCKPYCCLPCHGQTRLALPWTEQAAAHGTEHLCNAAYCACVTHSCVRCAGASILHNARPRGRTVQL